MDGVELNVDVDVGGVRLIEWVCIGLFGLLDYT